MDLGRILTSAAVALTVAGSAFAQQAPPAAPAADAAAPADGAGVPAPPKEYRQQILVPGSWFHGVHGLAFNKDDQLFAGSVVGQTIYRVQIDSARSTG